MPALSTAIEYGRLKVALVAGPPSPEKPWRRTGDGGDDSCRSDLANTVRLFGDIDVLFGVDCDAHGQKDSGIDGGPPSPEYPLMPLPARIFQKA
jgi:hypothetical protein